MKHHAIDLLYARTFLLLSSTIIVVWFRCFLVVDVLGLNDDTNMFNFKFHTIVLAGPDSSHFIGMENSGNLSIYLLS